MMNNLRPALRAPMRFLQRAHRIPSKRSLRDTHQTPLRNFSCTPFRISSVPTTNTPSANSPTTPRKAWRPAPHRDPNEPVYELYFTCKVCQHRSAHTISKQGYHKGTTLVKCPGCANRHLISDNLKIFADKPTTVEDLLREKGEEVRKGSIDVEGDLEFWEDDAVKGTAGTTGEQR